MVTNRLDINPKREYISRGVNHSHELFHVVNRIFTKYFLLLTGVFSMRFIALISTPSCVNTHDHMVLKHLSMES